MTAWLGFWMEEENKSRVNFQGPHNNSHLGQMSIRIRPSEFLFGVTGGNFMKDLCSNIRTVGRDVPKYINTKATPEGRLCFV